MAVVDITVPVDKFKAEVLDGKRPFEVLMMNGGLFEVWGYGSPFEYDVSQITELQYTIEQDIHMTGTFWAWDHFIAADQGERAWKQLELDGKMIKTKS